MKKHLTRLAAAAALALAAAATPTGASAEDTPEVFSCPNKQCASPAACEPTPNMWCSTKIVLDGCVTFSCDNLPPEEDQ